MGTRCPPGALEINWQVRGLTTDHVRVSIEVADGPSRPAVSIQKLGDQRLLLTGLPEAVVVVARPLHAEGYFADRTVFDVQVQLRSTDGGGDQIVLTPVDVSGTRSATLLTISPDALGWEVLAPLPGVPLVPADSAEPVDTGFAPQPGPAANLADLPALSARAAYSARRRIGEPAMPPYRRANIVAAVDRSASMLPHLRSGAVQSVVEMLVGVNAVAGATAEIPLWTLSAAPTRVRPDLDAATVDGYASTLINDQELDSGTAVAPFIAHLPATGGAQTVLLISDDVPPDLGDVRTALRNRGDRPGSIVWHFLVFGRGSTDPGVRNEPWRNEMAALEALSVDSPLTVSTVAPRDYTGWLADDLADQHRLDDIVSGLDIWRDAPSDGKDAWR
jgi:hypothetical protein